MTACGPNGRRGPWRQNTSVTKHLRLTCRNAGGYAQRWCARRPGVTITLNGEPYHLDASVSVASLLVKLGIDGRRVAVEHNLVVVRRAHFETTMLGEGDEVEIVNFVGGGTADP